MSANNIIPSIQIPVVRFAMPITDLIMELQVLRYKVLGGSTPAYIFYQIRDIFQMMETDNITLTLVFGILEL